MCFIKSDKYTHFNQDVTSLLDNYTVIECNNLTAVHGYIINTKVWCQIKTF